MRTMRVVSSDELSLQHHALSQHCVKPVFILIPRRHGKALLSPTASELFKWIPKTTKRDWRQQRGNYFNEVLNQKHLGRVVQKKFHFCVCVGGGFSCPKALNSFVLLYFPLVRFPISTITSVIINLNMVRS